MKKFPLLALWPLLAVTIGLYGAGNAWVAILAYHSGTLLGAWHSPGARAKLVRGLHPLWALSAIPLGVIAFVSVRTLLPWFTGIDAESLWAGMAGRLAEIGLAGPGLVVFFVYFVTIHPVLEDLAWHGVLADESPASRRFVPRSNDLWFALYHAPVLLKLFPGAWALTGLSMLVLVVSSMKWREVDRRTGGLQSVILQHAAADAGILAAVFWP